MNVQNIIIKMLRTRLQLLTAISRKKAGNAAFQIFCTPFFRKAYKKTIIGKAQHLSFRMGPLQTVGHCWNKGAARKLLLVHGFRSSSANFLHFVDPLVKKGYEVVAFDAPAHGLSEGKQLNAIEYQNFISDIHRQFGGFDAFITHSLGGLAVSMHLAALPENAHIKTVLIAPAANSRQLTELFFKEMRIKDPQVQQQFYKNVHRLSGKDIDWFSVARCMPAIRGPVFWLHDENDTVTPVKDALDIQKSEPANFSFLFTSGLGHRRIYRDPEVVAAIIRYL